MIEQLHSIIPLDTLAPVSVVAGNAEGTDPLEGLDYLAVIQPRGLSPQDNVSLDDWVREGGRLLLVLDPLLTGHYDMPLGDPRRPSDVALIPPVVARWGLEVEFDDQQEPVRKVVLGQHELDLAMAGSIGVSDSAKTNCRAAADNVLVRCHVGKGQVTLLADAAPFEGERASDERAATIHALMHYAWD